MQFGVKLPNLSPLAGREAVLATAQTAEALGYDSLWASDHLVFARSTVHEAEDRRFPVELETPVLDPLVTLAMVAGVTERIRLGTSVLVLANRNPVAIAKAWASIDALAPGRVLAGIGTGWQEEEFRALDVAHRFRRRGSVTEEFIEILRRCWTWEAPSFTGEHYAFEPLHFSPQPAGPIPVLLGGRSERGISRVARLGDGFHGTNLTPAAAHEVIERISEGAEAAGRDPSKLLFTTLCEMDLTDLPVTYADHSDIHLVGPPEEIAARLEAFAAAGMTHIALRVRALSGSTRPDVIPDISMNRGLEEIERFAADFLTGW